MSTPASESQSKLQDRAFSERRLGLLILENKDGAALAAGIPHFHASIEAWRTLNWPTRVAEVQLDLATLHRKAGHVQEASAAATEAFHAFAGATQDAQDIVLGTGQIVRFEQGRGRPRQLIGGAQQVEVDLQHRRAEGLALLDVACESAGHARNIFV